MGCADPSNRSALLTKLSDAIQELASVEALYLREKQRLYAHHRLHAANVTSLKAEVDHETAHIEADAIELRAEIDVLRLTLAHHDHICGTP